MPYVARHRIDAGEHIVYDAGQDVPEEIVDEAMVEAGSVELLTDKQFEALVDSDLARKSNAELRILCDERGLDATQRMNKDELIALLEGDDKPADDGDDGDGESQGQGDGGE